MVERRVCKCKVLPGVGLDYPCVMTVDGRHVYESAWPVAECQTCRAANIGWRIAGQRLQECRAAGHDVRDKSAQSIADRRNARRRERESVMRDLGLVKVRGAVSGRTYWE